MGDYLHRLAAQYQRGNPPAPVRRHTDYVATFIVRGFDDRGVRMLIEYMYPFEAHARRLRRSLDDAQIFFRLTLALCLIDFPSIGDHHCVSREYMKGG